MGTGIAVALVLDAALAHPGPWPSTAAAVLPGLGSVAALVYLYRVQRRRPPSWLAASQRLPAVRPVPALSARGMRLVAEALALCLIIAAAAAGTLFAFGHPRLAVAIGIAILVLAIPVLAASAWW